VPRPAASVAAGPIDTNDLDTCGSENEAGFGLIELVISMVIMQVALLALLASFSTSAAALGRAGNVNTAVVLADARLELYRSMPYDAIGLDTAGAPTTGNYIADTGVCPTGQTPVCGNTPPANNGAPNNLLPTPWKCTLATGSQSVSLYYSANGTNPCTAERTVTGATSPDGKTYIIETYVFLTTGPAPGNRHTKQVSVVVRNATGTQEFAKVQGIFDCSTSQPTASFGAPC
jgi:type II secretory pathway pseudopilin PulG